MKGLPFTKMSGSGNDFIIVDNRTGILHKDKINQFIAQVCMRKQSVGADGFILIENSDKADFKWHFYNADGGEVEMCGNGGRCAARFAYLKGMASSKLSFETITGIIKAEITNHQVKLQISNPVNLKEDFDLSIADRTLQANFINTGVPHVVILVDNLKNFDVSKIGREIRYHSMFKPAGTNANFINIIDKNNIKIRTYERGVEDETLACGTGSVAAALIASMKNKAISPVSVHTQGGEVLKIYFEKDNGNFKNVFLEGEARVIYEGILSEEALLNKI